MELLQSRERGPPTLVTAIQNSNPEHLGTDGRTDTHTSMPQHAGHTRAWDSHIQICPLPDPKVRAPGKRKGLSSEPLEALGPTQALPWALPPLQSATQ